MDFDRVTVSHHLDVMLASMDRLETKPFFRNKSLRHAFDGSGSGKPVQSLRDLMLDNIITLYHYMVKDVEDIGFEITDTYMRLLKARGDSPTAPEAQKILREAIKPLKMAKIPPDIVVPEFYRILTARNNGKRRRQGPSRDAIVYDFNTARANARRRKQEMPEAPALQGLKMVDRPINRTRRRNGEITEAVAGARQVAVLKGSAREITKVFADTSFKYLFERDVDKLAADYYLLIRMLAAQQCRGPEVSILRNTHPIRSAFFDYLREQMVKKPPAAGPMSAVSKVRHATKADPLAEGREERVKKTLSRIDGLPGLKTVKEPYYEMLSLFTMQEARRQAGMHVEKQAMHTLLIGPVGTGKTTIAKSIGEDLFERKILPKGHFKKINARDLIGPYMGHTEKLVKAFLERIKEGVGFIDEFYALFDPSGTDSYARAAGVMIMDFIEENRSDTMLIGALYPWEKDNLERSNAGWASRFGHVIGLPYYTHQELMEIFDYQLENVYKYKCQPGVRDIVASITKDEMDRGDRYFANGRYIRNVVETLIRKQAYRLDLSGFHQRQDLSPEQRISIMETLTVADAKKLDPVKLRGDIEAELTERKQAMGFIDQSTFRSEQPIPRLA